MKGKAKKTLAVLFAAVLATTTLFGNWHAKPVKAANEAKPITLDGFDYLTLRDFKDGDGNAMPTGEYRSSDGNGGMLEKAYEIPGITTLDKKLVSMRITYGGGEMQHSLIFGRGDWQGLKLRPSGDGSHLFIDSTWAGILVDTSTYETPALSASVAGLDSFIGNEFLLQMSFEYGEPDENNKADLVLGIYINGVLYNNEKITIEKCNMDNITSGIGVRVEALNGADSIITLRNLDLPVEPITLEGFENLTLKDFKDSDGNEMLAQAYSSGSSGLFEKSYSIEGLSTLDKKLVSMRITYGGGEMQHSLIFGRGDWQGLKLRPSGDGSHLFIDSTWAGILVDTSTYETPALSASVAGLDSFIGNEFLLQMSFEYGEPDENNKADLALGIYINGVLYNNEKITIKKCNMDNITSGIGVRVEALNGAESVITLNNVEFPAPPEEPAEPIQLVGFDNLTLKDFTDGTGNPLPAGEYKSTDSSYGVSEKYHSVAGLATLDKKLVSLRVTYGGGDYQHSLTFGRADWQGFNIRPSGDGKYLFIDNMWAKGVLVDGSTYQTPTMEASVAGLDSFVGKEFLLQMSFEFNDDDMIIGVYINGKLYNDTKFTIADCYMSNMQSGFGVRVETANDKASIITVDNVEFPAPPEEPEEPAEPIQLEGFDNLTLYDFLDSDGNPLAVGTYSSDAGNGLFEKSYSVPGLSNLHKKLVSMKITYGGGELQHSLIFGRGDWQGLKLRPSGDGSCLFIDSTWAGILVDTSTYETPVIEASKAGLDSFIGEEFILQLSFEYGEKDSNNKADLMLGVYINGTLYNDAKITIPKCDMANITSEIGLRLEASNGVPSVITLDAIEFPEEQKPVEPIQLEGFSNLTLKHFIDAEGNPMSAGAYSSTDGNGLLEKSYSVPGLSNLHKKLVSMKITYGGGELQHSLIFGRGDWQGLKLRPSGDGSCLFIDSTWAGIIVDTSNYETPVIEASKAGLDSFIGEEFILQLSFEYGEKDSNNKADLMLGVYINGTLYNDAKITIPKCDMTNITSGIGIRVEDLNGAGSVITLDSVELPEDPKKQPDESFEKITFDVFGIEDGKYDYVESDYAVKGTYKKAETLDKTVVCGDVFLSGDGMFQYIIGGQKHWDGLRFMIGSADRMNLSWFESEWDEEQGRNVTTETPIMTMSSMVAGVSFKEQKFNMMVSFERVGDDIKFGVWFDGELYANEYVTISGLGEKLGATIGVYCEQENDYVVLTAIPDYLQMPSPSFGKITFSDFGLVTGQYDLTTGSVVAQGNASKYDKIDKVVFSGDFRFSDDAAYQVYYASSNDEDGLRFVIADDGNMYLGWYEQGEKVADVVTITPEFAKVSAFTKNTFNLMISTELVDDDADGNVNDLQIGLWINEIRYISGTQGNFIVKDCGEKLANGFGVSGTTGQHVMLRNVTKYQSNPYYFDDISVYRKEDGNHTAPTMEGYVFGGWYVDEAYTECIDKETLTGPAFAKFVEEDVLVAKFQVKVDEEGNVLPDETSLRMITTVDGLGYRKVSFYLQKQKNGVYGDEVNAESISNESARVVYERLYYVGSNSKKMEYEPSIFSWQSKYFKTFTLTNIPSEDYDTMIKVTPFWETLDGTIVRGATTETCVNYYKPASSSKKSVAVPVTFLGKETMPITGYHGPSKVTNEADRILFPEQVTDEFFKLIADSGVNVIISSNLDYATNPYLMKKALELGEKYGIGIYVHDSLLRNMTTVDEVRTQIANYSGYVSFAGIYIVDEPGTDSYKSDSSNGVVSEYASLATILNEMGILTYVNMFPIVDTTKAEWWESLFGDQGIKDKDKTNYEAYINEVDHALNPAVLMWDFYPFTEQANEDMSLYFYNMNAIRSKAQAEGKPFWAFVQAGGNWNNDKEYMTTSKYYPSEGEFAWNVNTSLAFGAQGIQYFPLVQPVHFAYGADASQWDFGRNGLIGAWGNKTKWYDYAQEINEHIAEIDSVLMCSVNEGVIVTGDAANDTSGLNSVISSGAYGTYKLKKVPNDVMIGCFDYNGKTALYVVNYDYSSAKSITLEFTGTYDVKVSQNAETTRNNDISSVILNMDAGEGVLLVIE